MGMIQKQGNWVLYKLKPKDVERRFFTCEQLIQRQQRKGFLHRIVIGDEKWIFCDKPKKKNTTLSPRSIVAINLNINTTDEHSWFEDHALYLVGSKESCLLWSAETSRFHYWRFRFGIDYNWFVWAVHCEKNGWNTSKDMIKLFFFMTTLSLMSLKS